LGPVCTTGHSLCEKIGGPKKVKEVNREAGNKRQKNYRDMSRKNTKHFQTRSTRFLEQMRNIGRKDSKDSQKKIRHMPKPKKKKTEKVPGTNPEMGTIIFLDKIPKAPGEK
jgi:hypothetical protein